MAITIQELLASDTISQVVDKINFNFDQLLLNGGGPVGPAGASGPTGPIGGRGERGTEWYEGTDDPNVTAPTPTPLKADYYLQSNGDVWEYTGLTWNNTGINLKGPTGSAGTSAGWSFFGNDGSGNYFATAKNTSYPSLMPSGSQTINVNNEGVTTSAFGIAGPNDSGYPGIPLTTAFQLTSAMAGSLDSSTVTMLVHQKDSSASAIKFMGGGSIGADNYEQNSLTNLSSIKLGVDDSLVIDVPKTVSGTIGSVSDTYGFNVYTTNKAQNYRAGRSIDFRTGTLGNVLSGAYDVSDFNIQINPVNSTILPKFSLQVLGTGNASFEVGGNITFPSTTPSAGGRVLIDGSELRLRGSGTIRFNSATTDYKFVNLNAATGTAVGIVGYTSTGSLTSLAAGGSLPDGILGWSGSTLTGDTGVDNRVVRWDGTRNIQSTGWNIADSGSFYPLSGTRFIGTSSSGQGVEAIFMQPNSFDDARIVLPGLPTSALNTERLQIYAESTAGNRSGINIGHELTIIGDAPDGGFMNALNREVLRIARRSNNESPRIYIENGGGSDTLSPGVFAATASNNAKANFDTLTFKAGDGYSFASSYSSQGYGRDIVISGGDGKGTGHYGGDAYLTQGDGYGNTFSGDVIIGYNPLTTTGSPTAKKIVLGDYAQTRRGYVSVIQPVNANISNTEETFSLAVVANRDAARSDDRNGGLFVCIQDGSKGVRIDAVVNQDNKWDIASTDDNVVVGQGSVGNRGTNGTVFTHLYTQAGIRVDGPDEKLQLYAEGDQDSTTDFDSQNFTFYAEGNIHIDHTNSLSGAGAFPSSPISNPLRTRGIFASGEYGQNNATTGSGNIEGQWIRVGRNVTFTGIARITGSSSGQRVWPLPLTTGTTSVLYGNGTMYTSGGGTVPYRMVPVEAQLYNGGLSFKWGDGVWAGNAWSGTSSAGGNVRFTVQYMLA